MPHLLTLWSRVNNMAKGGIPQSKNATFKVTLVCAIIFHSTVADHVSYLAEGGSIGIGGSIGMGRGWY